MSLSVWYWQDVSPADGCELVEYLAAASLKEAAVIAAAQNGFAQRRTAHRLLANGGARKATPAEAEVASSQPGVVFWRSGPGDSWTPLAAAQ